MAMLLLALLLGTIPFGCSQTLKPTNGPRVYPNERQGEHHQRNTAAPVIPTVAPLAPTPIPTPALVSVPTKPHNPPRAPGHTTKPRGSTKSHVALPTFPTSSPTTLYCSTHPTASTSCSGAITRNYVVANTDATASPDATCIYGSPPSSVGTNCGSFTLYAQWFFLTGTNLCASLTVTVSAAQFTPDLYLLAPPVGLGSCSSLSCDGSEPYPNGSTISVSASAYVLLVAVASGTPSTYNIVIHCN
jgi:hypothetical protein